MQLSLQITLIAVSLLTALFVQLANMNKLNRKFIANKQVFSNDKYWQAERFSILGTLCFIIIFCLSFPSLVEAYHFHKGIQIVSYAIAGGVGNALFIYFLGRSEKYLKNQIDNKTNADE